jgi:phosphotransferase system IIA component
MTITILEYIQDMKTQSITPTIIYNMKMRFKSVFMEDIKNVSKGSKLAM